MFSPKPGWIDSPAGDSVAQLPFCCGTGPGWQFSRALLPTDCVLCGRSRIPSLHQPAACFFELPEITSDTGGIQTKTRDQYN